MEVSISSHLCSGQSHTKSAHLRPCQLRHCAHHTETTVSRASIGTSQELIPFDADSVCRCNLLKSFEDSFVATLQASKKQTLLCLLRYLFILRALRTPSPRGFRHTHLCESITLTPFASMTSNTLKMVSDSRTLIYLHPCSFLVRSDHF